MHNPSPSKTLLSLVRSFGRLDAADPLTQCLAPHFSRSLASQTSMPVGQLAREIVSEHPASTATAESSATDPRRVLATLYSWPEIQPKRFTWYNEKLLNVPLRRDILHRAVIFEADASRQGTASVKWRGDVHGSNRKILPQKGTGHARAGDKKSPIRRGGGKAFGPKPRDFSTDLQRKVYDLAWRTALSHRYRKGEIIITDNRIQIPRGTGGRLLANILEGNQWGKGYGRSLLVTAQRRERLFRSMEQVGEHGIVKDIWDVDVKDLLETGRVVIEKEALDALFFAHASDLGVKATVDFALRASKGSFLQEALPFSTAEQAAADSVALYAEEDQDILADEGLDQGDYVENPMLSDREAR